ncbi:FAD-binding oxidoreductase [Marisediminicola sp. LYQ85]|uniref:FAD-binding oxidoreductase n=1 Tax=Marisediminicola sp. LYQ85 TaxID=3391062 RepID=UPI0039839C52
MTSPAERALDRLRGALGDVVDGGAVDSTPATVEAMRTDKSGHDSGSTPVAVVTARSIADVQETLRIASDLRIGVVTRGAGTGLAGGAIAGRDEIVLSTLALDDITDLSVADETVVVGPGIINAELNRRLEPHGLWYAPDPASKAISTIGGNIATNAGGLLCAKYGVTREAVLGLTIVRADGTVMTLGHRTVKGVTGLDLTALVIGSEGTLGVIVDATLKLRPLPTGVVATIGAYFADIVSAAGAAAAITAAGLRPAAMELLDSLALEHIGVHLDLELGDRGRAFLLVQTDGDASVSEAERVLAIIRSLGGDADLTTDPEEGERLLAIRRAFHPALEARGTVLIEDVAVPRSALPQMFAAIATIGERFALDIPTVAHAGDGNLHPNFLFAGDEVPPRVWEAAHEVFRAALDLGGTLTGEHGVGVLKRRWLADELGDDQVRLQHDIKRVFDPLGILNPGKLFPADIRHADIRPANSGHPETEDHS